MTVLTFRHVPSDWPAAVIVSVWLFREKLMSLLPLLRVKHKDWEASFRLGEAEREAQALPPPPVRNEPPPTPEELSRFGQIAKISPRAAILEYRAEMDQAVRDFAQSVGMTETTRPLGILIRELRKHELIDQHTSAILDDLRAVGNSAAHGIDNEFSLSEALRFRDLAERMITQLRISTGAAAMLHQPAPLPVDRS
jgi:Domain of unknown function (DUF4145)